MWALRQFEIFLSQFNINLIVSFDFVIWRMIFSVKEVVYGLASFGFNKHVEELSRQWIHNVILVVSRFIVVLSSHVVDQRLCLFVQLIDEVSEG